MPYSAQMNRYQSMRYNRCGKSGIQLPAISLGLWHNFGGVDTIENSKKILFTAFDAGITHFDLANNYGPPPGSAEETFGRILSTDFKPYRDEMIISTKAGYTMWEGPYGDWGSRKYLISSLDQSLKRMHLDYVDIFYHHRPDPHTPIEETMAALDAIVRSGKASYAGISNYKADQAVEALAVLKSLGTPCLIHQPSYNMFNRWIEDGLLDVLGDQGVGCIVFSPLAQGLLTDRYLNGIPQDSRAAKPHGFLQASQITPDTLSKISKLNTIAAGRSQTLAQLALAWTLRDSRVTSTLIGASRAAQVTDAIGALNNLDFSPEELAEIEALLR